LERLLYWLSGSTTQATKAERTMPVKFSLRIVASVNPAMPFVYNEDLEIRISV